MLRRIESKNMGRGVHGWLEVIISQLKPERRNGVLLPDMSLS